MRLTVIGCTGSFPTAPSHRLVLYAHRHGLRGSNLAHHRQRRGQRLTRHAQHHIDLNDIDAIPDFASRTTALTCPVCVSGQSRAAGLRAVFASYGPPQLVPFCDSAWTDPGMSTGIRLPTPGLRRDRADRALPCGAVPCGSPRTRTCVSPATTGPRRVLVLGRYRPVPRAWLRLRAALTCSSVRRHTGRVAMSALRGIHLTCR